MTRVLQTLAISGRRAVKAIRVARHPAYRQALRIGVAAGIEHHDVAFRSDIATVMDVGASRGQFSLFAASRFPGAALVCFEPLDGPRSTLETVLPSTRTTVHPAAVGRVAGRQEIYVSARDDSSSLLPIGSRQVEAFPGTSEQSTQTVNVETLDSYLHPGLARPCLLKIDVQGFEYEVLEGAAAGLDHVDEVYVECSFVELYVGQRLADAVVCLLRERRFGLAGVYHVVRDHDGACLQADLLFRRVESGDSGDAASFGS